MADKKKKLGKGLVALFGEETAGFGDDSLQHGIGQQGAKILSLSRLVPNAAQPRRVFDDKALESLAQSLRQSGLLQPLLVRPHPSESEKYEIVAGERRWRAAQRAGLETLRVVVRELTDAEVLHMAIVENVQRQDLNPVEEAEGYRRLIDEFGQTQNRLARMIGKSRSHIANMLRLLTLPEAVRDELSAGQLSMGHARALVTAADPVAVMGLVLDEDLSVRETEQLIRDEKNATASKNKDKDNIATKSAPDPDILSLEQGLSSLLGLSVKIDRTKAVLSINYQTLDQLDRLVQRLNH